jgi:outer membrane cobalamin receptor
MIGIRQEGQQWGDEHGIEIDQYSANKVEILKGPGTIMYGSDAIAGVINILSPDPAVDGKIIGDVLGNYQSNNGLIGYSAALSGNDQWPCLVRSVQWKDGASVIKMLLMGMFSIQVSGKWQAAVISALIKVGLFSPELFCLPF